MATLARPIAAALSATVTLARPIAAALAAAVLAAACATGPAASPSASAAAPSLRPGVPRDGLAIHGRVTNARGDGIADACVTLGPPLRCWTRTSTGPPEERGYFVIDLGAVAATPGGTWDLHVVGTACGDGYSGVFTVSGVVERNITLAGPCR